MHIDWCRMKWLAIIAFLMAIAVRLFLKTPFGIGWHTGATLRVYSVASILFWILVAVAVMAATAGFYRRAH